MSEAGILAVALAILAIVLFNRSLGRVFITPPVACLLAGFGLHALGLAEPVDGNALLTGVVEATLALLLFSDAARINRRELHHHAGWAVRMLLLGLPLALVLGTIVLSALLDWPFLEILLLAALLVPTDAALSQQFVDDEDVPDALRETVAVESGLNDGLALPAILFIACAAVGFEHDAQQGSWLIFALRQIVAGLGVGLVTGTVIAWALCHLSPGSTARAVSMLLAVAVAYFGAETLGGNAFIACFCGGLAFGWWHARLTTGDGEAMSADEREATGFTEREGHVLMLLAFFYIGAMLLPRALDRFEPVWLVGITASLLICRPLAVWLSLAGSDADTRGRLILGWFGPRGLATALFALFALSEFDTLERGDDLLAFAILTVAISAVLHGASTRLAARVVSGARPPP